LLTRSRAEVELKQEPFVWSRNRKQLFEFVWAIGTNFLFHELDHVLYFLESKMPEHCDDLSDPVVDGAV
jgi:hypothetical protein